MGILLSSRKRILTLVVGVVASAFALLAPAAASAATVAPTGSTTGTLTAAAALAGHPVQAAAVKPSGYTVDGTPVYHLTNHTLAPLATSHACAVAGTNDGTREGVFCSDLVATVNSDGSVSIYPQAEGVCEVISNGTFPQCANIVADFGMWSTLGELSGDWEGTCGHAAGACPTPRFYTYGAGLTVTSGCFNVWTVVNAGSTIELPVSAHNAVLGANLGSGHQDVCV